MVIVDIQAQGLAVILAIVAQEFLATPGIVEKVVTVVTLARAFQAIAAIVVCLVTPGILDLPATVATVA